MNRPNARRRISDAFEDPTKRGILLGAAILVNFVLTFVNLFHLFDRGPAWVGAVVWVADVLVGLVFVGVLTYTVRDWRRRRLAR